MSSLGTRKGLTLLEVLITIFVMGIGMLSVLTLFPLAARKIGMSIDMDRATQMAGNASALASMPLTINGPSVRSKVKSYFDSVEIGIRENNPNDPILALPSEIIHYDLAAINDSKTFSEIGKLVPLPGWPFFNRNQWVSPDEYPFSDSGVPEIGSRRSERYSPSYLFRRKRLDDETSMETLILIYAGRPYDFGTAMEKRLDPFLLGGNLAGSSEISFKPGTFPLQGPGGPDRVFHRGSWVMDTKNWKSFYRVISIDEGTSKAVIDRPLDFDLVNAVWIDYMIDWFDRGSAP